MPKFVSLEQAMDLVQNGDALALGGNTLHRIPSTFVRELCKTKKSGLKIIKTAGAYDIDLLCACGAAEEIHAGYVGYENMGLALNYRKAVEAGKVKAMEHACYSVIAGLRAAAYGVPFMPINGFQGSDVPSARGFKMIQSPYGDEEVLVVPKLNPEWAVIHVQKCDKKGNASILGGIFEDMLMVQAAKKVIVTCEEVVETLSPGEVTIPYFMIDHIVHAPKGAYPCSCLGYYDADYELLKDVRSFDNEQILKHIREV